MEFIPTEIPDIILIKPKVYGDTRGFFMETYREQLFRDNGIKTSFVQDNLSKSNKNTIRGLHYQIKNPQAKLVMVTRGEILDVAVDIRKKSPTFGKYVAFRLSSENKMMVYIPEGFAHGFQVLSDETLFQYKCSRYYSPEGERGIAWNDPGINVPWITCDPIISEKDQKNPLLSEVDEKDLPSYSLKTII